MAEKCRAWLRKYCCDVFIHCSSKTTTDVYQECNAAQEQISDNHDICDRSTSCSAEVGLPVKQKDTNTICTDVDVTSTSRSTATAPLDFQKRQKKTIKPKSQSLRLKSHGVKLPGLSSIRLQRSSLSIDDQIANENSYCNVDFNKRLIKMFNMQIAKAENKQAEDESENVVPSPEKIYDDVYEATEEGLKTNKENEDVLEGWEENPEYDKSKLFKESVPQLVYDTIPLEGDSKQDPNSPTFLMSGNSNNSFKDPSDKETSIYDDIDQNHLYVNELQVTTTGEGFVHENNTTLRSNKDSEHVYINDDRSVDTEWDKNIAYAEIPADALAGKKHAVEEGWEDNIAYVGLSTDALAGKKHAAEEGWEDNIAYVGLLSTDALAGKEHAVVEEGWEENIAYAGIGNVDALLGTDHVGEGITGKYAYDDVFIDMKHDVSDEGWEENPAYHSRNNNLPVVCKTPSVRSENCSHGAVIRASTSEPNGGKRSRAYTESMVMRNNFQRDLRMAINLRAHKTPLPKEQNQVSANESYDNVDSKGTI